MNKSIQTLFRHILPQAMIALTLFTAASCSDSGDDPADPAGTLTVNMMNKDNGSVRLGNSDVFIGTGNNFQSNECLMACLGRMSGLGSLSVPMLDGLGSFVAVEPGRGYQIFKNEALHRFPSGNLAINVGADYYNVYVVSYIMKEEAIAGAVVKYFLADVPTQGLPADDTFIGDLDYIGKTISVELPASDFEYEYNDLGYGNVIGLTKEGRTLNVTLEDRSMDGRFGIFIRLRNSFTYVYGTVS